MSIRLEDLPPAARAQALEQAAALGLVVRRTRRARPPAGAVVEPAPRPADGRFRLSPAVAAWEWRKHPKCGWEGIGLCVTCEG